MTGRAALHRPARWALAAALLLAATLLVATGARASGAPPHPARSLVEDTTTVVFAALKARPEVKVTPGKLYALVEREVLPHFDFELMSRRVLGKLWRKAPTPVRTEFVSEYRALLVKTYSAALASFSDHSVSYLPLRVRDGGKRVIVRTVVQARGKKPASVEYAMYVRDGIWKVYDVTIAGVSLVATYRATFEQVHRANGFPGLLRRLKEKNREL